MQCAINTRAWMAEQEYQSFQFLFTTTKKLKVMASFATNWRDLSGENEWKGLLDPLNIDLRRYLLHYGERAQAISDGFIDEKKSKNIGLPRFAKRHFFSKVGLQNGNPYKYVVTNYLYAVLPFGSEKSTLAGYVAVSTDEGSEVLGRRDILISWRGTKLDVEWLMDANIILVQAPVILGEENKEAKVHQGWYGYYTKIDLSTPHNKISCRDQVFSLDFQNAVSLIFKFKPPK